MESAHCEEVLRWSAGRDDADVLLKVVAVFLRETRVWCGADRPNRTVCKNSAKNGTRRGSDGAEVLPGKDGARVRGRDGAEDLPVEGGAQVALRVESIWRICTVVFAIIAIALRWCSG